MTRGFSSQNITTNATTTVKSGAGILKRILLGATGAADAQAVVYDNTTGTGTKIITLATGVYPIALEFDVRFATGLTIVTTGGTPANLTIVYE